MNGLWENVIKYANGRDDATSVKQQEHKQKLQINTRYSKMSVYLFK